MIRVLIPMTALLIACTPEAPVQAAPEQELKLMSFTACSESTTKTSLNESYGIRWSSSDAVTLFASTGVAGSKFKVVSTESDGTVATFSGLTKESADGYYYALYPASQNARLENAGGAISAELPTVQKGVENSFAADANLSVARVKADASGNNDILHFKNAGALLSFTVPGNYLCRVRIESVDKNVAMTGPAVISYNDGQPVVTPGEGARNYVDVLVPEGTLGKRYYAVVFPGNYSAGFRVSFITKVNYYNRYTSSKPLELKRNDNIRLIEKNWVQNDDRASSETGYETVSGPMSISVSGTTENYYNFIVDYSITGLASSSAEHGLVFSYSNSEPTCGSEGAEGKLPGPVLSSNGSVYLSQCVPNACLQVGKPCYIRAYCYDNNSGNYVYSPVQQLTLRAQPEGFTISKTALESPAEGISISSFIANDTHKGYVAEAVCSASSGIALKVNNVPMGKASAISLASQMSSSGALVLVNGQIFGGQGNIGLGYTGGNLRYNNYSDDGIANCRSYGNSYSSWQPVTRAILGVDASGNAGAYWSSLIGGKPYFFNRPIPAGSAEYPQVTSTSGPGPAQAWSPQEALSTGPMLLYDGKVCVSEDKIATGVYYTNYELWETTSGNIYGSSRQRTAIGYNSGTGKFYLVTVYTNTTLTAMARIMKGLGCDYAMNLDGGLSTQMQVKGTGKLITNYSSRDVKSSIGFFSR